MHNQLINLKENSYTVFVDHDFISEIPQRIRQNKNYHKMMIITDANVKALYLEQFCQNIGGLYDVFVVEPGEQSKSLETSGKIYSALARKSYTRQDCIIALGGGVVGDLAGYVASTFLRGVDFIQVPTTLLSQVDSSVGGKVAINIEEGKNLVGSFYQPKAVYIDVNVLKTLPKREIQSGLGEVIKYAMIYDDGMFDILKDHTLESIHNVYEAIVAKSVAIKAHYVVADEKDNHLRMHLNFGHTIGHAIEKAEQYSMSHGQAIALGMYAMLQGQKRPDLLEILKALLINYDLYQEKHYDIETLMAFIKRDKKSIGHSIRVILLEQVGKSFIQEVTFEALEEMMEAI